MHFAVVSFYLLLSQFFFEKCQGLTVDENTITSDYHGLLMKILTNPGEVIMDSVASVAMEDQDWHGLTSSNKVDKLLTVALTEEMQESFQDSLRKSEIQLVSLSEVDSFLIGVDEDSGQSTLNFNENMYLRNNLDPDNYDFGKIWDIDTIYNFINHTTSQVSWMEELTYELGGNEWPLKIIKVSRYSKSSYKDQRVHVFMSSWDSSQWVTIKTVLSMLKQFVEYDIDFEDKVHPLVTRNTIYVIPLPNPQGYTQTINKNRFWNKNLNAVNENDFNCVGVNLGLNARTTVKTKLSDKDCDTKFDGTGPFSEIEVEVIMNFSQDLVASTSKPIYWFQFDERYQSVLLSPYTEGDLSGSPPNYTDILDFYKIQKELIVVNITYKQPYDIQLGLDAFYPVPESYFLDSLIERGITNTFLVGIPLLLNDKLKPVGDFGRDNTREFSLSLLRAVDNITSTISALDTWGPIIGPVTMIIPLLILIGSISLIFAMHEDTKRLENERAATHVDVPHHVRALGAQRQYETEVIQGKGVTKRTIGGEDT